MRPYKALLGSVAVAVAVAVLILFRYLSNGGDHESYKALKGLIRPYKALKGLIRPYKVVKNAFCKHL